MADKYNFGDIQAYAEQIRQEYSTRDADLVEYDKIFNLQDEDLPKGDHIKKTYSPDGRNSILTALRILAANDPEWEVPYDTNDAEAKGIASRLELLAKRLLNGANRLRKKPIIQELALSALLHDECHLAIINVNDLIKAATNPVDRARAQKALDITPIIFEPINARLCYPAFDALGLRAHYSVRKVKPREVHTKWGKLADFCDSLSPNQDYDYCEYWDSEYHAVWYNGTEILCDEHKLRYIPIACGIAEGSRLWDGTDYTSRQPLLYGIHKSGLWKRANLALTSMYTGVFAIAANPQFVYKAEFQEKVLSPNFDTPGGMVTITNKEALEPLGKLAVDPSMREAIMQTSQLMEQSSIYRTVAGENLGSGTPYSTVALLSQAGRQVLLPYQLMIENVTAEAMSIAVQMLKDNGEGISFSGSGEKGTDLEMEADEIPESLDLQCTMKLDLPQDYRTNAMVANTLRGFLPDEWIMKNLFGIGQPETIFKQRIQEQAMQQAAPIILQQQIPAVLAQLGITQPPPPPMPGQGAPMPGPEGMPPEQTMTQPPMPQGQNQSMPPELLQMMMQGQGAGQGMPQAGPELPPEMQGNGMPPEEEEGMPL